MRRRRAARLVVAVLLLAAIAAVFAVILPASPVYLPKLATWGGHHQGHPTRYWVNNLSNPDAAARLEAIHNLGAIGAEADEAVPKLAAILRDDEHREARIEAALALSKMAPASVAALTELAGALDDQEPWVRMNAAMALSRLRTDARPAVPALIKALQHKDNHTNLRAFYYTIHDMNALALGRASSGTADGVPALTEALKGARVADSRILILRAISEVGPEAGPAVPQLGDMLKDEHPDVREAAARALGTVGPVSAPAAPQLRELLKDSQPPHVRAAAQEALNRIEGKSGGDAPPGQDGGQVKAGRPEELSLPEAERKYLWDVEHHGNLLSKFGFGPLAAALRQGDAAALSRLLADDFAGADLREPRRVLAATDFAEVERLQDAGGPPVALDREAFAARLLEFRKVFAGAAPKAKLSLMTLSPKRRGQLDGAWEGTAQLRLHGEHAKGAPAEVVVVLRYETPRPTQEALSRPGWLRAAAVQQVLTAKAPRYLFTEVARQRGLDPSALHDNWTAPSFHPITGGVYVCDFDRDGHLDVLVTDLRGCTLYGGRSGGSFEEVTTRYGLPRQTVNRPVATWADLDGDGWEDLVLAGRFYRNEAGQRFTDCTQKSNVRVPDNAANVVVADYDGDGRLDLYVCLSGRPGDRSWLEGTTGDVQSNYLYRNLGDWLFHDVTRASGAGGGRRSTFTAAWLDANDDGRPDLHVPNEFGDGVLLVNKGDGTFREQALADRPADFGTMGLAAGDVDNDGRIDLYCANMYSKAGTRVIGNLAPGAYPPAVLEKMRRFVAGSQLHLNKGGLKFEQAGTRMQVAAVGWAYGAALADLDNDGWLDLYAPAGFVSRNRDQPDG